MSKLKFIIFYLCALIITIASFLYALGCGLRLSSQGMLCKFEWLFAPLSFFGYVVDRLQLNVSSGVFFVIAFFLIAPIPYFALISVISVLVNKLLRLKRKISHSNKLNRTRDNQK